MTESVLWWNKAEGPGGWLLRLPDGTVKRVRSVEFARCRTDVNQEGFVEFQPGGPRGVVKGEVIGYEEEDQA